MANMDGTNVGRVQGPIVGYAGDITLAYYWAPYGSLHLDGASLNALHFDVVYDHVFVCDFCWWHVCCMIHLCMDYVFVCHLCICVCLIVWTMCWTICVVVILKTNMFLCFILCYMVCFILFHLYFQFYMYKVSTMWTNQWVKYVCFLVIFPYFLYTANPKINYIGFLQNLSDKPAKPVGKPKIGSVYRYDSNFWTIWIFDWFCWFLIKPTISIRTGFLSYADFWNLSWYCWRRNAARLSDCIA
jgi:hypothetical protein